MATNYPGALDNLTNPTSGNNLTSPSHADQHANANDAIEAIEAELGTDPSGAAATVKARIAAVESTANSAVQPASLATVATTGAYSDLSGKPSTMTPTDGSVTLAKLADNSSLVVSATAPASPKIGTIWVQSDATVDVAPPYGTALIADGAITTAKIAAGAVQTVDLADSSVTSAKIADGTIVNADVSATAAIAPSKISGTAAVQTDSATAVGLFWTQTGAGSLSSNTSQTQGDLWLWPGWCPQAQTVSEVRIRVGTVATTGNLWRLGIYADASGTPGSLLADLGQVDPTSTGIKAITGLSLALPYGRIWCGFALQGSGAQGGQYYNGVVQVCPSSAQGSLINSVLSQASVTGALPSSFSGSPVGGSRSPLLFEFKRSA